MTTQPSPPPSGQIRIVREMAITHADFFRGLAAALAGRPYAVQHQGGVIGEDGRRIAITLSNEEERSVGALRLPVTRAEFVFSGYMQADAEAFMEQIGRYFQRGGG